MAHIAKFKRSQIVRVLAHNGRLNDDDHEHENKKIDVSKSYLNYDLCEKQGTVYERFLERLSEVKCLNRDNVNVLDSLVVHLPEDVKKGDERKFFEGVYAFGCQDYGKENIICACVHRDETREHMHLGFIPVVEKENKRTHKIESRVCHDEKITREYYRNLHVRLMEYMKGYLGYSVEILNGATVNGNKTILELKSQDLKEENDKIETDIKENERKLKSLKKQVQKYQTQYIVQQESINNLIGNIPPLVLEELPPKPTSPQKPEWKSFYTDKKEEREDKKAWKNYDKEVQIYEKKVIPQWKQDCDMINQRNEKKRDDYFNKYGNLENIKKMKVQVERTLYRVNQIEDKANRSYEKAEKERKALEEERKQVEIQKQQQELNQQRIIQALVQEQVEEEIKEIKGRQERLESFCSTVEFNDGSTVLDRFLEEENKQKVEEIKEEKEEYLSPEDF